MNEIDPRYDYFQEYQHDLNKRGLGFDNWKLHVCQADVFLRWLWSKYLDLPDVSAEIIRDYLGYRRTKGHRRSTLVKVLWVLRDFFDFAVRDELIPKNPTSGISVSSLIHKDALK